MKNENRKLADFDYQEKGECWFCHLDGDRTHKEVLFFDWDMAAGYCIRHIEEALKLVAQKHEYAKARTPE